MNFSSYTSFHIQTLIQDPQNSNIKESEKLLEENMGELLQTWRRQTFLKTQKLLFFKKKVDKFDFINIKIFCSSKDTTKK